MGPWVDGCVVKTGLVPTWLINISWAHVGHVLGKESSDLFLLHHYLLVDVPFKLLRSPSRDGLND